MVNTLRSLFGWMPGVQKKRRVGAVDDPISSSTSVTTAAGKGVWSRSQEEEGRLIRTIVQTQRVFISQPEKENDSGCGGDGDGSVVEEVCTTLPMHAASTTASLDAAAHERDKGFFSPKRNVSNCSTSDNCHTHIRLPTLDMDDFDVGCVGFGGGGGGGGGGYNYRADGTVGAAAAVAADTEGNVDVDYTSPSPTVPSGSYRAHNTQAFGFDLNAINSIGGATAAAAVVEKGGTKTRTKKARKMKKKVKKEIKRAREGDGGRTGGKGGVGMALLVQVVKEMEAQDLQDDAGDDGYGDGDAEAAVDVVEEDQVVEGGMETEEGQPCNESACEQVEQVVPGTAVAEAARNAAYAAYRAQIEGQVVYSYNNNSNSNCIPTLLTETHAPEEDVFAAAAGDDGAAGGDNSGDDDGDGNVNANAMDVNAQLLLPSRANSNEPLQQKHRRKQNGETRVGPEPLYFGSLLEALAMTQSLA